MRKESSNKTIYIIIIGIIWAIVFLVIMPDAVTSAKQIVNTQFEETTGAGYLFPLPAPEEPSQTAREKFKVPDGSIRVSIDYGEKGLLGGYKNSLGNVKKADFEDFKNNKLTVLNLHDIYFDTDFSIVTAEIVKIDVLVE